MKTGEWISGPASACIVFLLICAPLLAQEEPAGQGQPENAQNDGAPAGADGPGARPERTPPEPLLTPRPADVRHDAYDWDRPEPWSERPRDRTVPPPTQEDQRRPNLETMRDSQGRILVRYARELAATGRLVQALDRYRNFLVLYPRHEWRLEALMGAAEILLEQDQVEEAIGYLEQAYRAEPHRERGALAFLRAGKLHAEMGDFDRARRIFSRLVERKPTSRVERLASIELNSLGFLDSKTRGGKTGGSEQTPAPVLDTDQGTERDWAREAGTSESDDATDSGTRPATNTGGPDAENVRRDALDRMGEGVEDL